MVEEYKSIVAEEYGSVTEESKAHLTVVKEPQYRPKTLAEAADLFVQALGGRSRLNMDFDLNHLRKKPEVKRER